MSKKNLNQQEFGFLHSIVKGDTLARFPYSDWLEEQGRVDEAIEQRKLAGLVRKIFFHPAWDRTSEDPNKNYGIHGVEIKMGVVGSKGAVVFTLFTNWMLSFLEEGDHALAPMLPRHGERMLLPYPADLGFHEAVSQETEGVEECEWLGGRKCSYDGSGLAANQVWILLVKQGHEAVWKDLEERYRKQWGDVIIPHH